MRSSFWHVGINRTIELNGEGISPRIQSDGSIPFTPLEDHNDPDFGRLTYGEPDRFPWRITGLTSEDIAFFIETGTSDDWDIWSYYVVSYFVVEVVYVYKDGQWSPSPTSKDHTDRIDKNAHQQRGDSRYALLLGNHAKSKKFFHKPFRLTDRDEPVPEVKAALGLNQKRSFRGYWWKKWFGAEETTAMKRLVDTHLDGKSYR